MVKWLTGGGIVNERRLDFDLSFFEKNKEVIEKNKQVDKVAKKLLKEGEKKND